jgi:hypothetical protein
MIDPGHPRLSIVRQCELASISRSSFYREPTAVSEETLQLMRLIDEQFLETPWYGSRQMVRYLRRDAGALGVIASVVRCAKWAWRRFTGARRPANRIRSTGHGRICFAI